MLKVYVCIWVHMWGWYIMRNEHIHTLCAMTTVHFLISCVILASYRMLIRVSAGTDMEQLCTMTIVHFYIYVILTFYLTLAYRDVPNSIQSHSFSRSRMQCIIGGWMRVYRSRSERWMRTCLKVTLDIQPLHIVNCLHVDRYLTFVLHK